MPGFSPWGGSTRGRLQGNPWARSKGTRGRLQRKRTRAAPSDRSPSRWPRARSPLSTGCPGPLPGPTPRPAGCAPQTLSARSSATPGPGGGWMRAPPPRRSPEPDEPAGPAGEPGAGLSRNLPLIPAMSTTSLVATLPAEKIRLHCVTTRRIIVVQPWAPSPSPAPITGPARLAHRSPSARAARLFAPIARGVYTFRRWRGKIGSSCPLAHRAFGVWITPLSV